MFAEATLRLQGAGRGDSVDRGGATCLSFLPPTIKSGLTSKTVTKR